MKSSQFLLAALLPILVGSCGKADTHSWFKAGVVARPDGVMIIWRRDLNKHRLRLWMDHGSESYIIKSEFHAFKTGIRPGGGLATNALAMDYRWALGEPEVLQFPSVMVDGDRVATHQCHRMADIVSLTPVRCEDRALPVYRQIGTRTEALYRKGKSLVFAAGLNGQSGPCTISLEALRPDALEPFGRLRHYSGGEVERDAAGRLAISYLPPRTAYIVDHAGEGLPIYEARCGGLRRIGPLLENRALAGLKGKERFREFVDILDIVPTDDPDDPAVLLTWQHEDSNAGIGHAYAVIRPRRGLQRLPLRVEEKLGFDGGLCMCTAFWAGDPNRILLDVIDSDEEDRAHVRFRLFDLKKSRIVEVQTSYPLA